MLDLEMNWTHNRWYQGSAPRIFFLHVYGTSYKYITYNAYYIFRLFASQSHLHALLLSTHGISSVICFSAIFTAFLVHIIISTLLLLLYILHYSFPPQSIYFILALSQISISRELHNLCMHIKQPTNYYKVHTNKYKYLYICILFQLFLGKIHYA